MTTLNPTTTSPKRKWGNRNDLDSFNSQAYPDNKPGSAPPTSTHAPELPKSPTSRAGTLSRVPTLLTIDAGDESQVLSDPTSTNIPSTSKAPNGRGITRQYALFLEFNDDLEGAEDQQGRQKRARGKEQVPGC